MTHVVTLVAPSGFTLNEAHVEAVRSYAGPEARVVWLEDGLAADVFFAPREGQRFDAGVILGDAPVDALMQRVDARSKKLFLADMDSTMIGQECIDELADYVGVKAHVAEITERAMRGEIEFEPALRERVALLEGLKVDVVDEVIRERIRLTEGGAELVAAVHRHGGYACLVSGGFTLFTERVAAMIGFDEHRSNTLIVQDGKLTGRVEEPILGKQAKLDTLLELRAKFGLAAEETVAIGDGANDLAMIGEAGLGVAFHAKPAVAAAADVAIRFGNLHALRFALFGSN
jgi:phosphoserine phosphatase